MKGKISLEDLVEQFLDQCRSGNVPDIQDFAGAHPEFASELLALLPLVMEMEDWSVEKKTGNYASGSRFSRFGGGRLPADSETRQRRYGGGI